MKIIEHDWFQKKYTNWITPPRINDALCPVPYNIIVFNIFNNVNLFVEDEDEQKEEIEKPEDSEKPSPFAACASYAVSWKCEKSHLPKNKYFCEINRNFRIFSSCVILEAQKVIVRRLIGNADLWNTPF